MKRLTERIQVMFTPSQKNVLRAYARERDLTMSEAIRVLTLAGLERAYSGE